MEITGKLLIIGVYTGSIIIEDDSFAPAQLQFLLNVDCPREEVPQRVVFEIQLPGDTPPHRAEIDVSPVTFEEGHTRWIMRHAVAFRNPMLLPGKIEARVFLDDKAYPAVAAWIEKAAFEAPPTSPSFPPPLS